MARLFRTFYVEITGIVVLAFLLLFLSNGVSWITPLLDFTRDANPFDSKQLHAVSMIFLSIFIEGIPFILIGILVSSLIHVFLTEEMVFRWIPKSPILSVPMAACVGLLLPVCECGIVPVSRRLMQKGLPAHVAFTFLLAVPVINPITIVSTYVAFGDSWGIVTLRLLFAFGIAVTLGFLSILFFGKVPVQSLLRNRLQVETASCTHNHDHKDRSCCHTEEKAKQEEPYAILKVHRREIEEEHKKRQTSCCDHQHHDEKAPASDRVIHSMYHAVFEMIDTGKYFILGALIAAIFQTIVGISAIKEVGNNEILAVLLIMGLAFGLSVCSTADAFLAASFRTVLSTSPIMAFLVYGPMMDLKNFLMMIGSFRPIVVWFLFGGTTTLTFASVLIFL